MIIAKRRALGLTVALMSGLSWLPGYFVKKTFPRARPDNLDAMTSYADNMSMPSGHTAIIMALTVALCLYATVRGHHKRWFLIIGAFLTMFVGFFRMYAAAHYPLDLIVGGGPGSWHRLDVVVASSCTEHGQRTSRRILGCRCSQTA